MKLANYRIRHEWATRDYDGKTCWVQARAGAIPPGAAGNNSEPLVVMTMQKLLLAGSDVFYELNETRSSDLGKTWSPLKAHSDTLGRRVGSDGVESVICDATPAWHTVSGKLLSTGQVARYVGDALEPAPRRRATAYTVYQPVTKTWTPWQELVMPDMDDKFFSSGAGCAQRFDLENGEILLPIYFKPQPVAQNPMGCTSVTVCRCSFDGETLRYIEHGTELTTLEPRGLGEPSLTRFQGRFFLTLRNDVRGYVTSSSDSLHYDEIRPWRFDDGTELGNYNTQQHWVTHKDALFLVYTRRGLNNDHVFRHRAPLVMAQVDPERLCIIKSTERIVVPERGARMGNFAIVETSPNETWIVAAEWMQNSGEPARIALEKTGQRQPGDTSPLPSSDNYFADLCERFGSDNSVWVTRLLWDTPCR